MNHLTHIQEEMFQQGDRMIELAEIFDALSSDCRIEIIYLLQRVPSLPSGEIARLTNCTPSQVSQYLAKMLRAGIVKKSRSWREVEYSLNLEDAFIRGIVVLLSQSLKS